jgi:NhaA family Na+:H+ antiporter
MPIDAIREFLKLESAGGIVLIAAAALAMVFSNVPGLDVLYGHFLDFPVEVRVGPLHLAKPLLLWINDGMMAVFFLLVGLELKREILEGEFSKPGQVVLPGLAAVAGIALPGLIYSALNWGDPVPMRGWAIPTATDIAFALGVLALLGSRVPASLKLFLLAIAIIDDLGAILIIAAFYTADLSFSSLAVAGAAVGGLILLNLFGVTRIAAYMVVGTILWIAVLKSGVHATLAGVVLAFAIPLRAVDAEGHSPARHLEHTLHPWVAFMILPLFAFANAGIPFAGLTFSALLEPVPAGIALGLFLGKQVAIFGTVWLAVKLRLGTLAPDITWPMFWGMATLCGIGFTMSLFIGSLAFTPEDPYFGVADRLGVITGTLVSAVLGYTILRLAAPASPKGT